MGLVGGYSSDEEEPAADGVSLTEGREGTGGRGLSAKSSKERAESSEGDDDDDADDDDVEHPADHEFCAKAKQTTMDSNPLGLRPAKLQKVRVQDEVAGKNTLPTVTAFVPPQARKQGKVVSIVTDSISDRAFASGT
eukprot:TRINITY_DN222_c0_g2_i1.p1 TRINITY_DN222_c0_g2~~TRINITY_DN222_c0_g2_i1.p1  ORF type:complete len:137 (+),score=39.13 TRINITY_DN222_c0_g2_i1:116-526(+)